MLHESFSGVIVKNVDLLKRGFFENETPEMKKPCGNRVFSKVTARKC